jgi:hypothetical protein
MTNTKQFSIIILISIISLIFAGISFAGENSFTYTSIPSNFHCTATRVYSTDGSVNYSLPGSAKLFTNEYINGSNYANSSNSIGGSGNHSFPVVSSIFPSAQTFPYTYKVQYTIKVNGATVSTSSLTVTCMDEHTAKVSANVVYVNGDGEVVAMPPDNRFNWQSGDSNIAILYPEGESIGLYLYDGEQYLANFVSEADLTAYEDNAPAENTLLASTGAVSVYVLTTGEIQFNIGPDAEGKQYVLIMSDLSGSDMYGYEL